MELSSSMIPILRRHSFIIVVMSFVALGFGVLESQAQESAESWILKGIDQTSKGRHKEAIQAFQKAIELDPASENAYLYLGNTHYEQGSLDLALSAFREVLNINPANSTALFYYGLALIQQKKYAESIPYFEKAGTLDSEFKQLSLFYIGEAQTELGNPEEASEAWGRAIKINPTTDIARKTGTLVERLTSRKEKKPWTMSMSAGVEYDDNVTISLQDLATGEEDFANTFEFAGTYKVLETSKFELETGYDFFQSIYHELSVFDLQSHMFSLNGSYQFEKLDVDVFTRYNRSTLGGEDFMETYSIAPQIGFFPSEHWFALIRYSFDDSQFFKASARDGVSHGIGMDHFVFFTQGKQYLSFSYRFESKNTRGPQFDYAGHFITVGAKTHLPFWDQKASLKVTYRFFYKDYKNITPSLGRERHDRRDTIHVNMALPVYKNLQLDLNYQFVDSVSNLREIDFTENIASVGLSVYF